MTVLAKTDMHIHIGIIQYDSNCILGNMEACGFQPIYCSKTSLTFPIWQYWLGIAKPKKVFSTTLNLSNKL